jgi:hypothetical protein
MPRGGKRDGSGRKKTTVKVPVVALLPPPIPISKEVMSPSSPAEPSPPKQTPTQEELMEKLFELAGQGDIQALKLALAELPRVALMQEQTRALRLRNVLLRDLVTKKGLPLDELDAEFEPEEDPVQAPRRGSKAVGE